MAGKKNDEIKTLVCVRLSLYQDERIREISEAHNVSRSVAIRTLLEIGLSRILDERGYETPRPK